MKQTGNSSGRWDLEMQLAACVEPILDSPTKFAGCRNPINHTIQTCEPFPSHSALMVYRVKFLHGLEACGTLGSYGRRCDHSRSCKKSSPPQRSSTADKLVGLSNIGQSGTADLCVLSLNRIALGGERRLTFGRRYHTAWWASWLRSSASDCCQCMSTAMVICND